MSASFMSAYVPDLNDSENDTVGQIVHCIMRNEGTPQQTCFFMRFHIVVKSLNVLRPHVCVCVCERSGSGRTVTFHCLIPVNLNFGIMSHLESKVKLITKTSVSSYSAFVFFFHFFFIVPRRVVTPIVLSDGAF